MAATHEVLRPFTGMGQNLGRGDQVDASDWPERRVRMLVQYGQLRALPARPAAPPPADPAAEPEAGSAAEDPAPAGRRRARKED